MVREDKKLGVERMNTSTDYRIDKKRRVIIAASNEEVLNTIPNAISLSTTGHAFMAVPYDNQTVRDLRALGYDLPLPVVYYHDWGTLDPFQHQIFMTDVMVANSRAYVLAEPGLGKTRSAITAIDIISKKSNNSLPSLVVAPLSILHMWAQEVFKWAPHLSCTVLHGSKRKRIDLLNEPADIYCINYDGVAVILPELLNRSFTNLILDESTAIKNSNTKRFKTIAKVSNKCHRVYALTGTPTPQGPMDAHGQIKMVTPCHEVQYKTRFKNLVLQQISTFVWTPRPDSNKIIHQLMRPAARFSSSECLDLPDMMYVEREVNHTTEQAKAYKEMEKKLVTDIANQKVTAANSAVLMGKLIQICCGFIYDGTGTPLPLDATPRLDEVSRIISQSPGKTIVFASNRASLHILEKHLTSKGFTVGLVHGGVSAKDRNTIFTAFQNANDPKVLVAQERTASHGLTLTEADTVIWYNLPTSAETFTQANARVHRPGQKNKHYVVSLISSSIEKRLLKRLKNRENTQRLLLDMYGAGDAF